MEAPEVEMSESCATERAFHLTRERGERVAGMVPVLTGGRPARHQRRHVEGLLWLRQTGASWRRVPAV